MCLGKYFANNENNYVLHLSATGQNCTEMMISLNFNFVSVKRYITG